MGTISYYLILIFLTLTGKRESFMKKSLENKIKLFWNVHDLLTTIYWIGIVAFIGVGIYPMAVILFIPYLIITIYESYKGRILFMRDYDVKEYERYFNVDWEEVKRIVKKQKEENEQASTEDND